MKTNPNESASPLLMQRVGDGPDGIRPNKPTDPKEYTFATGGLTKREYISTHSYAQIDLQDHAWLEVVLGRTLNKKNHPTMLDAQCEALAIIKVRIADKIIEQLNK